MKSTFESKIKMLIFIVLISVELATSTFAANSGKMICSNPRRNYTVNFDMAQRKFELRTDEGSTRYKVKSISDIKSNPTFKGDTVNNGPNFVAYTGRDKRIEFYDGFDLIQVDYCE